MRRKARRVRAAVTNLAKAQTGASREMNDSGPARVIRWLFDPRHGATNQFLPRWLFLRAIGLIYFSAFFSLLFQIRGLIGPDGVLPASEYLEAVAKSAAAGRFWYAPTVFWFSTSSHMLMAVCWIGLAASVLVVFNIFPRVSLFVCFVELSIVCRGIGRILGLPIGWHAARSRIHRAVSRADGISSGLWRDAAADSRWYFLAALGMVPHLLRVGNRENRQRRSGVAALHGDGRVLPEWAAADVDRLVHAAFAALVSRGDGVSHVGAGACSGIHAVFAAALAHRLLFHRDAVADRRDSLGELYVSQLSGARARDFSARRSIHSAIYSCAVETRLDTDAVSSALAQSDLPIAPQASRRRRNVSASRDSEQADWTALLAASARQFSAHAHLRDVRVAFLRQHDAARSDGVAFGSAADGSGDGAGTVSHRRSLRSLRADDARALRNRIPRLDGWTELDDLSISEQAAGSARSAADLRAVSAAIRLESVVCVAERLAFGSDRCAHGRAVARGESRMLSRFSSRIRFRSSRRASCAPSSGNTGSARARRNARKASGGRGSFLDSTRRRWSARRTAS